MIVLSVCSKVFTTTKPGWSPIRELVVASVAYSQSQNATRSSQRAAPSHNDTIVLYKDVLFIVIDADNEENHEFMEFFGMKKNGVPSMKAINLENFTVTNFKPESPELTKENIKKFASDFIEGKLKGEERKREDEEEREKPKDEL